VKNLSVDEKFKSSYGMKEEEKKNPTSGGCRFYQYHFNPK
jgi:hypothetical protein